MAVLTILLILLPYMSGDYRLMYLFAPMLMYLSLREPQRNDLLITVLWALLLVPKNYYRLDSSQNIGMIISDINMPIMDGITFITEVKKTPLKYTPILVLTTESQEEMKMKGKKAGASGWLVKPFKPEQLVYVTKKFLR